MANKKERPAIENPLAGLRLDDIVRGITTPTPEPVVPVTEEPAQPATRVAKEPRKRMSAAQKRLDDNLNRYTGISEQGVAIWLPREVKKRLDLIRANAERNIPLRSLAAAIIMTYIEENESVIEDL